MIHFHFRACVMPAWVLLAFCGASPASAQTPATLGGTAYVTSCFGCVVTASDLAAGSTEKMIPVGIHDHNLALRPGQKQA